MALSTVIEETPGVRRFQVIQTGPATLTVRLEAVTAGQEDAVWQVVEPRLHTYLAAQGLATVTIARAASRRCANLVAASSVTSGANGRR